MTESNYHGGLKSSLGRQEKGYTLRLMENGGSVSFPEKFLKGCSDAGSGCSEDETAHADDADLAGDRV